MKILVQIFDALFPPRATQLLVRSVTSPDITTYYLPRRIQNTLCLSSYQEPLIKALITEIKFYGSTIARRHLATLLETLLATQTTSIVLIPIPLSARRERERGYNQVTVVLESLHPRETITIDTNLLKRSRHTTAQTSLKREDRLKNLTGAFVCEPERALSYKDCTFIIIDDVLTTGATMLAARAAIEPHLHPTSTVVTLALAH